MNVQSILCYLGFHRYGKWSEPTPFKKEVIDDFGHLVGLTPGATIQRVCSSCNHLQSKFVRKG